MKNNNNPRLIIVQLLYSYFINNDEFVFNFKNPYKRFIKKICKGVVENNDILEEKIKYYLDKKFNFKNFELIFLLVLKSAIFEILFLKKTPYKVVINEYLNVSKFFLLDEQKSIINAVLDKVFKEISWVYILNINFNKIDFIVYFWQKTGSF